MVATSDVDDYLARLDEPKLSYAMPAFTVDGLVAAGLAAFKNHLSYLPHTGSALGELGDALIEVKLAQAER